MQPFQVFRASPPEQKARGAKLGHAQRVRKARSANQLFALVHKTEVVDLAKAMLIKSPLETCWMSAIGGMQTLGLKLQRLHLVLEAIPAPRLKR